ncbi:nicotinamide mononucleotide transporter [Carnobacteriaceae bacterium zg-84]|uniref:nicotinamide mononucleotide transporter n=1 Tax=Granulicatella sp. zg-84 TaxID=2678503 RepID=UPI0013BF97A6|nr:nicotinamide mononucleotide transporter [Granulicatella sp. zg-84]NEW65467.1 hypothetical protein [Granulicatella sp. zg-84]QMI85261.1 nicotinamide mononucleotide transporter [Carnobacteriaceae bacterium zg-84]
MDEPKWVSYFDKIWFLVFLLLTFYTVFQDYRGMNFLVVGLILNNIFDAYMGVVFSNGLKRHYYIVTIIGCFVTAFVKFQYDLVGGVISALIGAVYAIIGYIEFEDTITYTDKHDLKPLIYNAIGGCILFFVLYTYIVEDKQNIVLIIGNFLVFILGMLARFLLIRGKSASYIFFIIVDIVTILVEIQTYLIKQNNDVIVILINTFMLLVIDSKACYIWQKKAFEHKQQQQ